MIYRAIKCQRIDKSLPKHLVLVFAYMSGRLGKGYKRNHGFPQESIAEGATQEEYQLMKT